MLFKTLFQTSLFKNKFLYFFKVLYPPVVENGPYLKICGHSRNKTFNGTRIFHSSSSRYDLMEFFDDPKNFGENEVRSGRAWTIDELRIKSNSDLHKLWFVLYKEKNMLLTMEYNAKQEAEYFPSPERIDKHSPFDDHLYSTPSVSRNTLMECNAEPSLWEALPVQNLTFNDSVQVDTDILLWRTLSDAEIVALDHNNTESDKDESEELTPEAKVSLNKLCNLSLQSQASFILE
ncbi:39S ribosomal protein L47, mitochondrial [Trichonephila clavata]|uniref:Large ribosomal subunit protein uL29m n=1 Tax=Trichonephila clavata TaxID=2740835 RepID=A0A8X6KWV1_TRICU|nr:39S ribosomal protein L47, mitochondrial [Trichonephila clavata]